MFRRHLPPFTRILSQPEVVADSLEDYLARHQHYVAGDRGGSLMLMTTGDPAEISARARVFWSEVSSFERMAA
jgi:glutamate racemase